MSINSLGPNGLTIQTLPDIISEILNGVPGFPGLFQIYGADINVNPNTPDGQEVALFSQAKLDALQQLQRAYNSFDPDQATGTVLDQRCAYNGVVRQAGTNTLQNVNVTTSGGVTLPGVDLFGVSGAYTVADGNGNQYALLVTTIIGGPSTTLLEFEAAVVGPVSSAPGAITVPITILPNILSVSNPAGPITIGVNEESDVSLRIRRANSTALPSKGYWQGLVGALIDVEGVSFAEVIENIGPSTDGNGIPGHSIWTIVSPSTGDSTIQANIANAIYIKRNAGCGMKGAVTVNIPQTPTQNFAIKFDFATPQNLWFRARVIPITGSVDIVFIAQQVLAQFGNSYGINQAADSSSIVCFIKDLFPNASIDTDGVSTDGVTYSGLVQPAAVNDQFVIAGSSFVSITT
jgi:hypothetical protein